MFKYKNISNTTLIIQVGRQLKYIKPQKEFTSKSVIDNKFLVEISEKPVVKEYKKQVKQ